VIAGDALTFRNSASYFLKHPFGAWSQENIIAVGRNEYWGFLGQNADNIKSYEDWKQHLADNFNKAARALDPKDTETYGRTLSMLGYYEWLRVNGKTASIAEADLYMNLAEQNRRKWGDKGEQTYNELRNRRIRASDVVGYDNQAYFWDVAALAAAAFDIHSK